MHFFSISTQIYVNDSIFVCISHFQPFTLTQISTRAQTLFARALCSETSNYLNRGLRIKKLLTNNSPNHLPRLVYRSSSGPSSTFQKERGSERAETEPLPCRPRQRTRHKASGQKCSGLGTNVPVCARASANKVTVSCQSSPRNCRAGEEQSHRHS